jgi:hypothetical protein
VWTSPLRAKTGLEWATRPFTDGRLHVGPRFGIVAADMTDELLRKIQHVLDRRITNEKQVVYLMVELRKLMDREKYNDPVLRTFGNWIVHTSLSYPREGSTFLLDEFDHLMTDLFEHKRKSNQLNHISLTEFRVALHRCFQRFGLSGEFVKKRDDWKKFVQLYSSIVSECPIVFTASKNTLKYIKQVELTGVSRLGKQWRSVDWRLTLHGGKTINWGFILV